jgi:mannosyltransferase
MLGRLWRCVASLFLLLLCLILLFDRTRSLETNFPVRPCTPEGPVKAAILYLFPMRRMDELKNSLKSVFTQFNDKYRYRVFLFHDEDCKAKAIVELSKTLTPDQMCLLRFYRITHRFPAGFDEQAALRKGVVFQDRWPGYQHMCAFWWKWVFEHPKVRELEYFMRLDTDSLIKSPVTVDLFQLMKTKGYYYGYRFIWHDPGFVVKGLWRFYREYMMKTLGHVPLTMKSQFPAEKDLDTATAPVYYTNFEIVYRPFFTDRKDVVDFIDDFFLSGNMHTRRWGDAPLRYFLVQSFLNVSKHVHHFCEVHYWHMPVRCNGCDCHY